MTVAPSLLVAFGIGMPELLHAEVAVAPHPRFDVHARVAAPLLQPALGGGVRGYAGALADETTPPRWAATAAFDVTWNPAYPNVVWGTERIGLAFWPMAGVHYLGDRGLLFRAEGGALLGFNRGPEGRYLGGGPNLRVAVGFGR